MCVYEKMAKIKLFFKSCAINNKIQNQDQFRQLESNDNSVSKYIAGCNCTTKNIYTYTHLHAHTFRAKLLL